MPRQIARLALQNKRVLYGILFRASSEALSELAADPKRLGARIGFLAVLHTWTQRLEHHPHVHCVIPAGGLRPDRTRWISSRKRFFLPVRPLSRLFRGKFLDYLKQAFQQGQLQFHGSLRELEHPVRFDEWLASAREQEWGVYAKPPFGGPEHVLKYLARYTHRVAIANGRLISLEAGTVRFQWRDSEHGNEIKETALDALEFIRRFLLHVLPGGFVKIRHFGFLSNRNRKQSLSLCRTLLPPYVAPKPREQSLEPRHCPACHLGIMRIIESTAGFSYTKSGAQIDSS